jgi:uncharacterized protein
MAPADTLRVEVVYCPGPGLVDQTALNLAPGSTVADALKASGVMSRHGLSPETVDVGVWCRVAAQDAQLRDRDRVEIYRPLLVDPKEARRQRYKRRAPPGSGVSGKASAEVNGKISDSRPK